jgi:hypothetical protein
MSVDGYLGIYSSGKVETATEYFPIATSAVIRGELAPRWSRETKSSLSFDLEEEITVLRPSVLSTKVAFLNLYMSSEDLQG